MCLQGPRNLTHLSTTMTFQTTFIVLPCSCTWQQKHQHCRYSAHRRHRDTQKHTLKIPLQPQRLTRGALEDHRATPFNEEGQFVPLQATGF